MSYVSLNLIWGKGVSCEKLSQGWVAGNGHGGESRGIVTGVGCEELSLSPSTVHALLYSVNKRGKFRKSLWCYIGGRV